MKFHSLKTGQLEFENFLQENKINKKEKYTFSEIEDIFILARDKYIKENTLSEKDFSSICTALVPYFHTLPKEEKNLELLDFLFNGEDLHYYSSSTDNQKMKNHLYEDIKNYTKMN